MVRLYRSPSPGRRRLVDKSEVTRSPMCGAGVLGKLRGTAKLSQHNNVTGNSSNQLALQANAAHNGHNQTKTFPGSYESVGSGSSAAGRRSPDSTESSTSSHREDGITSGDESSDYVLQFEPNIKATGGSGGKTEENSGDHRQQMRKSRIETWVEEQRRGQTDRESESEESSTNSEQETQMISIRHRGGHMWSSHLPVVAEEHSLEGDDSSPHEQDFSSPERNYMLLRMRQLVLRQQAALAEVSDENSMYRKELQECRKLLQLAKEAYTKQQKQVEALNLEKESADAEVMWLREEVKTLRAEIYKQQEKAVKANTWALSKSSEEVEERLRRARAETPERRRKSQVERSQEKARSKTPDRNREKTSSSAAQMDKSVEKASSLATRPVDVAARDVSSPTPMSPIPSPMQSPTRDWTLKSILPNIDYLTDEDDDDDDDDDLMKEIQQEVRTTMSHKDVAAKEKQKLAKSQQTSQQQPTENRDDIQSLSPRMWLDEEEDLRFPEDELRDMPPSRTSTQENAPLRGNNLGSPRASLLPPPFSMEKSSMTTSGLQSPRARPHHQPVLVESNRSEVSFADSRSREEVAMFKSRLDVIQKKREQRKQLEEFVGSRSGRVRFT